MILTKRTTVNLMMVTVLTIMKRLDYNDIANHIREIPNDATLLILTRFIPTDNKWWRILIFQGIIDADPSCTFPLSIVSLLSIYKGVR